MSPSTVLCPVDFSDESGNALRWARVVADRRGATLIVLHAVEPLLAEAAKVHSGVTLAGSETEAALRDFVSTTAAEDKTPLDRVRFRVRVGDPADVILEEAGKEQPALIVMGTHGLGGFTKLLIGSTTEHVLRRARHPVLAVPPSHERPPKSGDLSVGIGRILVGTDFSAASLEAARWAAAFAREIGVPLLIAHIVMPIAVPSAWQSLGEQTDESRVNDARRRLDELSKEFPGLNVETVVGLDRAEDALVSLSDKTGAGLIVVGLSSEEAAVGSIAYRVVCLAKALVLLVPRAG